MRLGLGTYTFRWSIGHKGLVPNTPMSAMKVLDIAIARGVSVVQYADNLPLHELSELELDELDEKATLAGVALELGIQSFKSDEMRSYIAIARRLSAKILRVALDGPDAATPIDELATEFTALLPAAEDAGVRIAIENHFNYPSDRLVDLLKTIDDNQVGVCLDVANSICAGEWPMETVAKLAPFAINLHLKDYVIVPDPFGVGFRIRGCPLGQGRSDCRAVLAAADYPKDMSVIMEHWLPRDDDMDAARALEHQWLKESLAYARTELGLA